MIYVLTEYNEQGSGYVALVTTDKKEAMSERLCTLTTKQALKKYGFNYFYTGFSVKSSVIASYPSKKAMNEGRFKTRNEWY